MDAVDILQLDEGGRSALAPGVLEALWHLGLQLRWAGSVMAASYLMAFFDWDV